MEYKKINGESLEITNTQVITKANLLQRKKAIEQQVERFQLELAELDKALAVFENVA